MKCPVQLWQKDLINQLESKKDLCVVPVEQGSCMELYSECSPQFKKALERNSLEREDSTVQEPAASSMTSEIVGPSIRNSGSLPVPKLWTVSSNKRSVSAEERSNLKGRLGHLMRAIDSHRSSSAGTSRVLHKDPQS